MATHQDVKGVDVAGTSRFDQDPVINSNYHAASQRHAANTRQPARRAAPHRIRTPSTRKAPALTIQNERKQKSSAGATVRGAARATRLPSNS